MSVGSCPGDREARGAVREVRRDERGWVVGWEEGREDGREGSRLGSRTKVARREEEIPGDLCSLIDAVW